LSAVPDITAATSHSVSLAPAKARTDSPAHESLGFGDLLDAINPLQHIPIIGTLYRAITGDKMSPIAEIAGGALFGGIVGAVTSLADVVFTQATGKRFGEGAGDRVLAWLGIGNSGSGTQIADAKPSSGSTLANTEFSPAADPAIAARIAIAYKNAIALTEPAPSPALYLSY